jgi:UDP-arabinose 4-epimerase
MTMPSSNDLEKKKILVAGGAGYIGSHTVKQLLRNNYAPVILDNMVTGNRFALRGDPFYEGSIGDRELVQRIVKEERIEGVILFAAHAYVGESTQNPRKYYENNIGQTLSLLGALLDSNVNNLVFSSSCSIYGTQEADRMTEDLPKNPLSPYAETKLFVEEILNWYEKAYGLRSARLRYFNAAGADAEGELGETHDPETHLIPLAIRAAMGGPGLRVFGDTYPTPDGTAIRDYVHVTDLGDAHVLALGHLLRGGEGFAVNLGTGSGSSIREVMAMVEKVTGNPVVHSMEPKREGDAARLVANPEKAKQILGWEARHSSLENIIRTAWNWQRGLSA